MRHTTQERREPRHLVEDRGRVGEVELATHAHTETRGHPTGQLTGDPPIRPRLPRGLDGLSHALHATLGVGERPLLLGEGGRGQENVGPLGRLVKKQVLHDQHVELIDRLLGVMEIRLREQRVLPDHVHGADVAGQATLHHLGHDLAGGPR
jgi:hypothetical protein